MCIIEYVLIMSNFYLERYNIHTLYDWVWVGWNGLGYVHVNIASTYE